MTIRYYIKRLRGVFDFCTTVFAYEDGAGIMKFQDFGHTAQLAHLDVCHTCPIFWMSMGSWGGYMGRHLCVYYVQ